MSRKLSVETWLRRQGMGHRGTLLRIRMSKELTDPWRQFELIARVPSPVGYGIFGNASTFVLRPATSDTFRNSTQ